MTKDEVLEELKGAEKYIGWVKGENIIEHIPLDSNSVFVVCESRNVGLNVYYFMKMGNTWHISVDLTDGSIKEAFKTIGRRIYIVSDVR